KKRITSTIGKACSASTNSAPGTLSSKGSCPAAGHDDEQFAACQACEVRTDEQRRLDHAEKDVSRGRETDRAADLERALEQKGETAHDRRQNAPVEEECSQDAHHQHDRQGLQREHELRAGHLELEGKLPAAKIAEHERRAGLPRRADCVEGSV